MVFSFWAVIVDGNWKWDVLMVRCSLVMEVVNWINLTRLKSYVLAVVVVTKCKRFSEDYLATFAGLKSADDLLQVLL
jgi:predicted XRE-type DNA-binding protein